MRLKRIFLSYTKRERSAILVLSSLLLIFMSSDIFFRQLFQKKNFAIPSDSLVFYRQLLLDLENESSPNNFNKDMDSNPIEKASFLSIEKKIKHPYFDPNSMQVKDWMELGFSEKQGASILRYMKSIGGFKEAKELAACYVISEKKYKELKPFIRIKETDSILEKKESISKKHDPIKKKEVHIELNKADSIGLLELQGIGPFYAGKIISYRKRLGGYYSTSQLLELWKFDSLKLEQIKHEVYVDTSLVNPLKLNRDTLEKLYQHPYLDYNTARAIFNYREQHGSFTSIEDLKKIVLINDSLFRKLHPYLSLE